MQQPSAATAPVVSVPMSTAAGYIEIFDTYRTRLHEALSSIDMAAVSQAVALIERAWLQRKQIIVFGNGGSALTALHFITDWNKAIPAQSGIPFFGRTLLDNIGLVTAYGNDASYDRIFADQIRNLAGPGDVVVAVSGSGNSPNVLAAAKAAKNAGSTVVAVVGYGGGNLLSLADAAYVVHAQDMQICEDLHVVFGHLVMRALSRCQ